MLGLISRPLEGTVPFYVFTEGRMETVLLMQIAGVTLIAVHVFAWFNISQSLADEINSRRRIFRSSKSLYFAAKTICAAISLFICADIFFFAGDVNTAVVMGSLGLMMAVISSLVVICDTAYYNSAMKSDDSLMKERNK